MNVGKKYQKTWRQIKSPQEKYSLQIEALNDSAKNYTRLVEEWANIANKIIDKYDERN